MGRFTAGAVRCSTLLDAAGRIGVGELMEEEKMHEPKSGKEQRAKNESSKDGPMPERRLGWHPEHAQDGSGRHDDEV